MSFPFRPNVRPVTFNRLVEYFRSVVERLPDERTGDTTDSMVDAALGVFTVFFTQSPSFLDFKRTLQVAKGSVRLQHLDTIVSPLGNIHATFAVYSDSFGHIKLSLVISLTAKCSHKVSIGLEHLDPGIPRIRDIDPAFAGHGNSFRTIEFIFFATAELTVAIAFAPPNVQEAAVRLEDLHSVVFGVRNIHPVSAVHCDSSWSTEPPFATAFTTPRPHEAAVGLEDLNTIIPGVRHINTTCTVHRKPFGVPKLSLANSITAQSSNEGPIRLVHLDPVEMGIRDVDESGRLGSNLDIRRSTEIPGLLQPGPKSIELIVENGFGSER